MINHLLQPLICERFLMVANSASRRSSWRSIFAISFVFLVFIIHSILVVYRSVNITSHFGTRQLIRKNLQHIKHFIFNWLYIVLEHIFSNKLTF